MSIYSLADTTTGRALILADCIEMGRLAAWIYDDRKRGWPMSAPDIDDEVIAYSTIGSTKISTQGAAIVTRRKLFLVFRGSESILSKAGLKDWLRNLNFLLRAEYYGIRAHRGFVKAAKPVLKQVREIIEIYHHIDEIHIGGHSLGGDIATAIAVAVWHEFRLTKDRRNLKLITEGQARFSRKRYLDLALQFVPYYRVQNGSDAIPRKPLLGYSHAGLLIYTANSGELLFNPGHFKRWADRLFTFRQRLTDHSALDYLRELRRHHSQLIKKLQQETARDL
jgi:hypothetical protein